MEGEKFVNRQFMQHLQSRGIKKLISCPHTPQQNGLADRKHRHITELGITMMYDSKVPQQLWVEAFFTATFIANLLPSSVLTEKQSPYEVLNGHAPVYTSLRVFGCKCYTCLRPYMKNKLDPKSLVCVFLGYNKKYKGYRSFYPPTGKVFISRHVLFDENHFPFGDIYSQFHKTTDSSVLNSWRSVNLQQSNYETETEVAAEDLPVHVVKQVILPKVQLPQSPVVEQEVHNKSATESSSGSSSSQSDDDNDVEQQVVPPIHSMATRACAGIIKPNPRYAMVTVKASHSKPRSLKAALQDPGLYGAMKEEVNNMEETETFELVPSEKINIQLDVVGFTRSNLMQMVQS